MTWHYIKLAIKTAWHTLAVFGLSWFSWKCWSIQYDDVPVLNGMMLFITMGLVVNILLDMIRKFVVNYYDMIADRNANPIQQFGRYFYIFSNNGHKVSRGYTSYVAALDAKAKMSPA
jgi:hypothetical protein